MSAEKIYQRFDVARRIEHLLLVISFSLLGFTGLPQKFPTLGISQFFTNLFGGIETIRIIHHISALVLAVLTMYHFVVMIYKLYVERKAPTMAPGPKDVVDGVQSILHNLGFRKEAPRMGRYNFIEKLEYWAMIWGTLVMGLTGFMLWNPIFTAKYLPGVIIPAAKMAHGWEAVLAVAAILLWHFYTVHLRSWNWSMIKGHMTHEQMEEEHVLEMEAIERGEIIPDPTPEQIRKRLPVFIPIALIMTMLTAGIVFAFVGIEDTVATTYAPVEESVPVYAPQTPTPLPVAEPTAVPAAATTWEGGYAALFDQKCGMCHGTMGSLSVATYADLLKGGASGPALVGGDAAASKLVQVMQAGGHPGQFTAEELQAVIDWINAGAPEK
jgi:cytochrome b subunit of formate dehydrogenase/mono/diheme cytochrome c family protein